MYVLILVVINVDEVEHRRFLEDSGIECSSPSPNKQFNSLNKKAEDLVCCSGAPTTHLEVSDGKWRPSHVLFLGEELVNWDVPDKDFRVRFIWNCEAIRLPEWIACGAEVVPERSVVIALGAHPCWNKKYIKNWVAAVVSAFAKNTAVTSLFMATQIPRSDQYKMQVVNFNKNLAAAVSLADLLSHVSVCYLPVHRFVLSSIDYPHDGILDRVDTMKLRVFVASELGLAGKGSNVVLCNN